MIGHGDLADVVKKTAALERREIPVVESDRTSERDAVRAKTLTVAARERIARFDRRAEPEDHRFRRLEIVGVSLQTNERLHARAQLGDVERLQHEIVGARLDAFQAFARLRQRGDDDDWDEPGRLLIFQAPVDLERMTSRDEIDEDEIGRVGVARGQDRFRAVDDAHVVAFPSEKPLKEPCTGSVVIGYENRGGSHRLR